MARKTFAPVNYFQRASDGKGFDLEGALQQLAKCCGVDCCDNVIRLQDQTTGETVEISVDNGVLLVDTTPADANPPIPVANSNRYLATLAQAGTAAPTATVILNQLSGPIVWARSGVGVYTGTLTAAFVAGKTVLLSTIAASAAAFYSQFVRTSANVVTLSTFSAAGAPVDLAGTIGVSIEILP